MTWHYTNEKAGEQRLKDIPMSIQAFLFRTQNIKQNNSREQSTMAERGYKMKEV
jgi:hypothetical protein